MEEQTIVLTTEQLKTLKAEITAEVLREVDSKRKNKEPYITHQIHKKYENDLFKKFGAVWYDEAWQAVKKLALYKNHLRRVNQITPNNAEQIGQDVENILLFLLDRADIKLNLGNSVTNL